MKVITLDFLQFDYLTREINKTDWWQTGTEISAQILIALIALYSGYFFQQLFRKRDLIELKKQQASDSNHAMIYLASIMEGYFHYLTNLIIPSYERENEQHDKLCKGKVGPVLRNTFFSIYPPEILKIEHSVSKIFNIGQHAEFLQIFFRIKNQMKQLEVLAKERNLLIEKFIAHGTDPIEYEIGVIRYGEIFDRTTKMMVFSEFIFDGLMHLVHTLAPIISNETKLELHKNNVKNIRINTFSVNEHHEKLREKLKKIIDTFPDCEGRLLHTQYKT